MIQNIAEIIYDWPSNNNSTRDFIIIDLLGYKVGSFLISFFN